MHFNFILDQNSRVLFHLALLRYNPVFGLPRINGPVQKGKKRLFRNITHQVASTFVVLLKNSSPLKNKKKGKVFLVLPYLKENDKNKILMKAKEEALKPRELRHRLPWAQSEETGRSSLTSAWLHTV